MPVSAVPVWSGLREGLAPVRVHANLSFALAVPVPAVEASEPREWPAQAGSHVKMSLAAAWSAAQQRPEALRGELR